MESNYLPLCESGAVWDRNLFVLPLFEAKNYFRKKLTIYEVESSLGEKYSRENQIKLLKFSRNTFAWRSFVKFISYSSEALTIRLAAGHKFTSCSICNRFINNIKRKLFSWKFSFPQICFVITQDKCSKVGEGRFCN